MSEGSVELVRVAYDVAYRQRSVSELRDRFASDFVWHNIPEFPGGATYRLDDMPDLWADLDETYSEFVLAPTRFEEHGDFVVVTVETSARLRGSDMRVEGTRWHLWRLRGGKLCESWVFSHRRQALEQAGVSQ